MLRHVGRFGPDPAAVTLPRTRFSPAELAALAREVSGLCRRAFEPPQVLSCKGMTTLLFSEKPALRAVFGQLGQRPGEPSRAMRSSSSAARAGGPDDPL